MSAGACGQAEPAQAELLRYPLVLYARATIERWRGWCVVRDAQAITWERDFARALERSLRERKPVLVDVRKPD